MAKPIDPRLFVDVQEELGLPSPALVEKDYYVVQALSALSRFTPGSSSRKAGEPYLVFGGGTALCRAHRIIMRMSEDIDLKIVWVEKPTIGQRKAFRGQVSEALLAAGFKFDPEDRQQVEVLDGKRSFKYHLPYEQQMPAVAALRPEIQVELSSFPVYLPTVDLPISSFVAQARGDAPEIEKFPCAAIEETAAEKFVALTRRIGEERALKLNTDHTLQRHVYDLNRIHQRTPVDEAAKLAREIMLEDAKTRAGKFEAYGEDPLAETLSAIEALSDGAEYPPLFDAFQASMVYGDAIQFEAGIAILHKYRDHLQEL